MAAASLSAALIEVGLWMERLAASFLQEFLLALMTVVGRTGSCEGRRTGSRQRPSEDSQSLLCRFFNDLRGFPFHQC